MEYAEFQTRIFGRMESAQGLFSLGSEPFVDLPTEAKIENDLVVSFKLQKN